jgi:hypothetical protein
VVQKINQNSPNYTTSGHFIESIQQDLIFFRATKFVHVPRICNKVAHKLAREAIRNKVECVWLEEIPPSIFSIVCRELSGPYTLYWGHYFFTFICKMQFSVQKRKESNDGILFRQHLTFRFFFPMFKIFY